MKRQTVIHVSQKLSTSERRTCNVLAVARSTMTYQSKDQDENALRHDIVRLAKMNGRYGCRKIAQLLRVSGWKVNYRNVEEFGVRNFRNCQRAINVKVGFITKIAPSAVCFLMRLSVCGASILSLTSLVITVRIKCCSWRLNLRISTKIKKSPLARAFLHCFVKLNLEAG